MDLHKQIEQLLETEFAGDILNEIHQCVHNNQTTHPTERDSLIERMAFLLSLEGYKVYKNLSLFQGEQVDEFVCQLLPYYNDQQMVLC